MVSGVSNISLAQSCSLDICSLPCQGRKSRAKEAFGLWILVVCAWIWIEFVWLHCKRMKVVQISSRSSSHEKAPADLSCFFWLPWNQDRGWCKRLQVRKKKGFQWIDNDKNDSTTTTAATTTTTSTAILKLQLKVYWILSNDCRWLWRPEEPRAEAPRPVEEECSQCGAGESRKTEGKIRQHTKRKVSKTCRLQMDDFAEAPWSLLTFVRVNNLDGSCIYLPGEMHHLQMNLSSMRFSRNPPYEPSCYQVLVSLNFQWIRIMNAANLRSHSKGHNLAPGYIAEARFCSRCGQRRPSTAVATPLVEMTLSKPIPTVPAWGTQGAERVRFGWFLHPQCNSWKVNHPHLRPHHQANLEGALCSFLLDEDVSFPTAITMDITDWYYIVIRSLIWVEF